MNHTREDNTVWHWVFILSVTSRSLLILPQFTLYQTPGYNLSSRGMQRTQHYLWSPQQHSLEKDVRLKNNKGSTGIMLGQVTGNSLLGGLK